MEGPHLAHVAPVCSIAGCLQAQRPPALQAERMIGAWLPLDCRFPALAAQAAMGSGQRTERPLHGVPVPCLEQQCRAVPAACGTAAPQTLPDLQWPAALASPHRPAAMSPIK